MAKSPSDHISLGGFVLKAGTRLMVALRSTTKPSWTRLWHLWTVLVPRRSITGKLVYGRVWRRHDGRRWVYKRFSEFDALEQ
jgi:hypothetical protein